MKIAIALLAISLSFAAHAENYHCDIFEKKGDVRANVLSRDFTSADIAAAEDQMLQLDFINEDFQAMLLLSTVEMGSGREEVLNLATTLQDTNTINLSASDTLILTPVARQAQLATKTFTADVECGTRVMKANAAQPAKPHFEDTEYSCALFKGVGVTKPLKEWTFTWNQMQKMANKTLIDAFNFEGLIGIAQFKSVTIGTTKQHLVRASLSLSFPEKQSTSLTETILNPYVGVRSNMLFNQGESYNVQCGP